jgi:hypothetical protein
VAGALLGPRVHFLASFLIDEGDGYVLGENEEEVVWLLSGRRFWTG